MYLVYLYSYIVYISVKTVVSAKWFNIKLCISFLLYNIDFIQHFFDGIENILLRINWIK